jgi:DNA-binding response OmpR family regulator
MAEPRARVLIVDDDPDLTRFIRINFEAMGLSIVGEVHDGDTGLQAARDLQPDLVLSDFAHPGLNGFELVRAIRDDPRLSGVRIILLTAKNTEADRSAGLDAGADIYIAKPFDPVELLRHVQRLLGMGGDAADDAAPGANVIPFPSQQDPDGNVEP